jgi:hypothetical protein
MYSADPVQPRPNPIRDAVPTPRPTPYLWTGLGWTNFGIFFSGRAPTQTLCVDNPPNHAAARALGPPVPDEADLATCRAERARRRTTDAAPSSHPNRPNSLRPGAPDDRPQMSIPSPAGRRTPTRGERR